MNHMETTQDLVSDQQLVEAFGNADFGSGVTPRQVVARSLLQYACGYSTGHVAYQICEDLGLAIHIRSIGIIPQLTNLGKKYLYAAYSNQVTL